ncbi:MAG TPA: SRPBCC family protein [Puia sp.]|nr:SRPBCC family protein [Puia sp.]
MHVIKAGLICALLFFLVLTGISLLFPSHQRVSRAINIAAPAAKTYAVLGDLRTWDDWNSFIKGTPLTGRSFSSPSSGAGASLRSDQLNITILASTPDSVRIDWDQTRGKRFTGGFNIMQLSQDSLTVQWWFDFQFRWYPWEKFGSLVYDHKLGPVMEESLAGLKRFLENSK